ncbi:MAG: LysR family transcriptional regulator [Pseudomonadota bacterium]
MDPIRLKPAHIQLVLRIAETGKLQAAAELGSISQPAASRILRDLERDLGVPLFERTPQGMEPTEAGDAFVRHARTVVSELDSLKKEVTGLAQGSAGEIRLGSVTAPAVSIVGPVVDAMRRESPGLSVTVEVGPSAQMTRGLASGRLDFILARFTPDLDTRNYIAHPAQNEPIALIVRKDHPLAWAKSIPLAKLLDYDWVIQEPGSPIRGALEAAFLRNGLPTPKNVVNSSSLLFVQSLLAASDIIAPQAREVANLLCGDAFGANLRQLSVSEEISVTPYFVIRSRVRPLTQASELCFQRVLSALKAV